MAYNRITWIAKVLREAGLEVVEHDGWRGRGLSTALPFDPKYVVWHHDASPEGDSPGVPAYMIRNMATHGAQLWVDRKGVWHLVASGRMAHAGTTRNHVTNFNSVGVETDHTTGEQWPTVQLASLRKGTAAILKRLKQSAEEGLHFHKTICDPPGRKVDPDGLDLQDERGVVATALAALQRDNYPAVSIKRLRRAAKRSGWAQTFTGPRLAADRRRVKRALKAEGAKTYRHWQRKAGLPKSQWTGVPDRNSLTQLGERHQFRVVE